LILWNLLILQAFELAEGVLEVALGGVHAGLETVEVSLVAGERQGKGDFGVGGLARVAEAEFPELGFDVVEAAEEPLVGDAFETS